MIAVAVLLPAASVPVMVFAVVTVIVFNDFSRVSLVGSGVPCQVVVPDNVQIQSTCVLDGLGEHAALNVRNPFTSTSNPIPVAKDKRNADEMLCWVNEMLC